VSFSKFAALVIALVLPLATAAQAVMLDQNVYLSHSGSIDPTTEGWTLNPGTGGTVSSGPGSETIGASSYDYWFTNDSATEAGQTLSYSQPISSSQYLNAWSLRARVRALDASGIDQQFVLHDGTDRWGVWILNDSLINPNGGAALAMGDFNGDYREIEMLYTPVTAGVKSNGDSIQLYVDQVLAATQTRLDALNNTSGPNIAFGGNSSLGTGEVHWNQIEFVEGAILGFAQELPPPAPEPGTGLLLLLGCTVLKLHRRGCRQA
jgi:hypothetical protein